MGAGIMAARHLAKLLENDAKMVAKLEAASVQPFSTIQWQSVSCLCHACRALPVKHSHDRGGPLGICVLNELQNSHFNN